MNLKKLELDVLKEIGNIGAAHAVTALAFLLKKRVNMQAPRVRLLKFDELVDLVGGAESSAIATFLRVEGEAAGNLFFILDPKNANKILEHLLGVTLSATDLQYEEIEQSALAEIGNILAGSYLSSLADFTKIKMKPCVPMLAVDMVGAILSQGFLQFGQVGDTALVIETQFLEGKEEMKGHFFFIPDPDSFQKIFEALGV